MWHFPVHAGVHGFALPTSHEVVFGAQAPPHPFSIFPQSCKAWAAVGGSGLAQGAGTGLGQQVSHQSSDQGGLHASRS